MRPVLQAVVLVGHGGVPKDCPQDLVTKLKRLEAQRRAARRPPSQEEIELDTTIRRWPRTAETDPYLFGLQAVATHLQSQLNGVLFGIAFNEFCAPTLAESVRALIDQGATDVIVTTTMFTPGGSHSEIEIPDILAQLRPLYPHVSIRYAWPFDLNLVASTLAEQIRRFSISS
ncbi:MAG: CbiX/SirB N-terminal domain-containing protein [Nitrospira sp.]|nr:CbiX/SirB N-terminal domain-containing protein [Nitrospira sp.]MCP9441860.1 CbiX/SirB N-terminal domain-containing protein [Nitrospira sp.]